MSHEKPTLLDLFSGIGGFSLAFEAEGFETIAFSEVESYASKILKKHWPDVPNLGDIRGIKSERADVIAGGFPCQDISLAGPGGGLSGARSGLWGEQLRIIQNWKPFFAVIENVAALRIRGADTVLSDLEESGYTCGAFVVPAWTFGAQQIRERAWIIAHLNEIGKTGYVQGENFSRDGQGGGVWPDASAQPGLEK